MDLPSVALIDIFSRLPLNSILICRCVCKTWRTLILDPLFSNLHLARAPLELFLRSNSLGRVSTILHWVDLDCIVKTIPHEPHQTKLSTKLYLSDSSTEWGTSCSTSLVNREYGIVNSCNGLLCLSKAIYNNPCLVCNPLTGEYISIPIGDENLLGSVVPGFGYCSRSNSYKVVRLVFRFDNMFQRMAEVYTLGTESWRSIGCAPFDLGLSLFTTYFNGFVHWVSDDEKGPDFIVSFDIGKEQFGVVPPPPHFGERHKEKDNLFRLNMGVLGGCLSVCDVTSFDHFDIWMMKEYGDPTSWTKEYVISTQYGGLHRPIKYLDNEDILMIYDKRKLVVYNPRDRCFRSFRILGVQSIFEAIAHVPSFTPLKDAIGGDHLNVQTIKSSCAMAGSWEEAETLFLAEQSKPRTESRTRLFWADDNEE